MNTDSREGFMTSLSLVAPLGSGWNDKTFRVSTHQLLTSGLG